MIKVLVFGTFDGVHEGHRAMLRQAKALGDYLIVVVAPDHIVKQLKGTMIHHSSAERIKGLKSERIADEVILGDTITGKWAVLKRFKPDIIALGYDQLELKVALEEYFAEKEKRPTIVMLKPFKPETFKSSLLKDN